MWLGFGFVGMFVWFMGWYGKKVGSWKFEQCLRLGEQKPFTLLMFFVQLLLCYSSLVLCSSLKSKYHIPPPFFFSLFVNLGSRFCISIVEVVKSYQILSLVYMFFFFSPKKLLGIWWLRDWEIFEFVCIWQDQFARTRMDFFVLWGLKRWRNGGVFFFFF